jgi:hypothetical protein
MVDNRLREVTTHEDDEASKSAGRRFNQKITDRLRPRIARSIVFESLHVRPITADTTKVVTRSDMGDRAGCCCLSLFSERERK